MAGAPPKRRKVEMTEEDIAAVLGTNFDQIFKALIDLRKLSPVDLKRKFEEGPALANSLWGLLGKCVIQNFDAGSIWIGILKSVLALINFSFVSKVYDSQLAYQSCFDQKMSDHLMVSLLVKETAAIEQTGRKNDYTFVRVLESGIKTSASVKRLMLRVLTSVARSSRFVGIIINNSQLVDRIAITIGHEEDKLGYEALKVANLIVQNKNGIRAMLLSNTGFYLGNLLGRTKEMNELFAIEIKDTIFTMICRFVEYKGAKQIGRQLAGSNGVDILLARFLNSQGTSIGQFEDCVLEMCNSSFELREQFVKPGCIQKIVQASQPLPENMLKMLLCFAQDAWGRAALRGQGALDLLINQLESGTFQEKDLIVNALRYFVHDGTGLNYIVFCTKFLEMVVSHINTYLQEYRRVCKLLTKETDVARCVTHTSNSSEFHCSYCTSRGQFSPFLNHTNVETFLRNVGADRRHRRVSPIICRSWSPSQSPPPGCSSPQISLSYPSSFPTLLDAYVESFERFPQEDKRKECDSTPSLHARVVIGELFILSWLTHDENNLIRLMTAEIIDTLLRYIADAPSMASKAPRAIRRIFRHRLAVENLAHLELHTRVIHILKTRKCMVGKRLTKCSECVLRADFGDIVLDEFASHIDAPFGLEVLKNLYKSTNEMDLLKASIATLHLVRRVENWSRMVAQYQPVKRLLNKLYEILTDGRYEENCHLTTYENGPSLLYQILVALSYLISIDQLMNSLRSTKTDLYECLPPVPCSVKIALDALNNCMPGTTTHPDIISFIYGDEKEIVPKKLLCEGSEYFRGMFRNAFTEQFQDTFQFSEEKEQCTFRVFRCLLHLACGCGRNCSDFSVQDMPALLRLSDRYLCNSLCEVLLAADGPLRDLITGDNLPDYLDVMLTIGNDPNFVLRDACMSYLLRYCTEEEMFNALKLVVGNQIGTELFMDHLKSFLKTYSTYRQSDL